MPALDVSSLDNQLWSSYLIRHQQEQPRRRATEKKNQLDLHNRCLPNVEIASNFDRFQSTHSLLAFERFRYFRPPNSTSSHLASSCDPLHFSPGKLPDSIAPLLVAHSKLPVTLYDGFAGRHSPLHVQCVSGSISHQ